MRIRLNRIRIGWLIIVAAAATLGIVISLLVLGSPERDLAVSAYSNLIRFQAEGVATLQVRIFDLSGKVVWDSSVVSGDTIDWDRNNDFGERLAYGAYIYSAQGWNAQGDLIFQKNGKLALMPGDKVQLQAAPAVSLPQSDDGLAPFEDEPFTFQPMAVNVDHSTESWAFGQIGIGTTNPSAALHVAANGTEILITSNAGLIYGANFLQRRARGSQASPEVVQDGDLIGGIIGTGYDGSAYRNAGRVAIYVDGSPSSGSMPGRIEFRTTPEGAVSGKPRLVIKSDGKVGIGTTNPSGTLEVHGFATNLLALYGPVAPTDPKFRVEKNGTVLADGAYHSGTGGFHTGGADVAERISTSEWVEPGYVVEIDPEHPGFFRKSSSPYSTKVAGIISTSPGVILGNNFDTSADKWEDNRPVLAVTGRVPCKVSAENGPIEIGDLLVASSTSGVAMKGNPEKAMGAVVGKAMEPLKEGEGTITVQVMLR